MPFKSKAQRRKFYALKAEGKMDQKTIDEWESKTPKNIPEKKKKKASLTERAFEKRATIQSMYNATKYLAPKVMNKMFGGSAGRTIGGSLVGGVVGGATAPGGHGTEGIMKGMGMGAAAGFGKKPLGYLLGKGNKTMGKMLRYSPAALGAGVYAGQTAGKNNNTFSQRF